MFFLHHIAISVADLEQSSEWYRNVLGLTVTKTVQRADLEATVIFMESRGLRLELFCFSKSKPLPEYRKSVDDDIRVHGTKHFALDVEDIEKAITHLRACGVNNIDGPHLSWSQDNLYAFFADVNGILIELFQRL